jgi:hypothetical protein
MNQKLTGKRLCAARVSVPGALEPRRGRRRESDPVEAHRRLPQKPWRRGVRGAGNAAISSAAPADVNTQGV